MNLRTELEPNIKKAEELYSQVLELLTKFDVAFDNFDENEMDYIVEQINLLTNKFIDKEDIYEYWSYTSIEDLTFSFALPSPIKVDDITEDEISEIKNRIEVLSDYDDNQQKSISEYLFDKNVILSLGLIDHFYRPLLSFYETNSTNVIYL